FLDILFVTSFNMGVAGVAWATFIAQGISSLLSAFVLLKRIKKVECDKPKLFSASMLRRISKIAVPSILQQSFVSVGNLFIQGLINGYGASVVAGFAAAMKLNTFTITTLSTLGNGLSSYTAQNIGAGDLKRVKKGFNSGLMLAVLVALPFFIAFFFSPEYMMRIFVSSDSSEVIAIGVRFLKIVSPFYFLITIKLIVDGILRGAGAMLIFMTSTFSDLILRVAFAFILSPFLGEIGIWLSWPIGWSVASIISMVFYFSGMWKKNKSAI
ncbi:MAG: MATE family efflux transporter, partial [Oscillospiraceae bacterium]